MNPNQVPSDEHIKLNMSITALINQNTHTDGTCFMKRSDGSTITKHLLQPQKTYTTYQIDHEGQPHNIGVYVFTDIDRDRYVLRPHAYDTSRKYNVLLIPYGLADRYVFISNRK